MGCQGRSTERLQLLDRPAVPADQLTCDDGPAPPPKEGRTDKTVADAGVALQEALADCKAKLAAVAKILAK